MKNCVRSLLVVSFLVSFQGCSTGLGPSMYRDDSSKIGETLLEHEGPVIANCQASWAPYAPGAATYAKAVVKNPNWGVLAVTNAAVHYMRWKETDSTYRSVAEWPGSTIKEVAFDDSKLRAFIYLYTKDGESNTFGCNGVFSGDVASGRKIYAAINSIIHDP